VDDELERLKRDLAALINLGQVEESDDSHIYAHRDITLFDEPEFFEIGGEVEDYKMGFVDGGNHSFFAYGPLIMELNRLAYVVYRGTDRLSRSGPHNFLSLTYLVNGEVKTKIYGDKLPFMLEELEPRKTGLGHAFETIRLGGRARRIMELNYAAYAAKTDSTEAVILDGNLGHGNDEAELASLVELFNVSQRSGVTVVGFTKRTSLMIEGLPVTYFVDKVARAKGLDYYSALIGKAVRGDPSSNYVETQLFVTKLNSRGVKPYLVEVGLAKDVAKLFKALAANSTNVYAAGYPLGLVEADRIARIQTSIEGRMLKLKLQQHLKGSPLLNEGFAHDLLDVLNGSM
jgi:hypothetical protein